MKLFYKSKNRDRVISDQNIKSKLPYKAEFKTIDDGRIQIDFSEKEADFKQFYDTTRLIVDTKPLEFQNCLLYNCMVAWYNQDDNISSVNKEVRRLYYKTVLAQIDLRLLQTDPAYCKKVMKELLDKKMVERYIENGFDEDSNYPSGNYIGGVIKSKDGYRKVFNQEVGKAVHNSENMIKARGEHKEIEEYRKKIKEISKFQIEKVKDEGEEWYR